MVTEPITEPVESRETNGLSYVPSEPPFIRPKIPLLNTAIDKVFVDTRIKTITRGHYVYGTPFDSTFDIMPEFHYKVGAAALARSYYNGSIKRIKGDSTTIPVLNTERNYVVSQPNVNGAGKVHLSPIKTETVDPVTGNLVTMIAPADMVFIGEQFFKPFESY